MPALNLVERDDLVLALLALHREEPEVALRHPVVFTAPPRYPCFFMIATCDLVYFGKARLKMIFLSRIFHYVDKRWPDSRFLRSASRPRWRPVSPPHPIYRSPRLWGPLLAPLAMHHFFWLGKKQPHRIRMNTPTISRAFLRCCSKGGYSEAKSHLVEPLSPGEGERAVVGLPRRLQISPATERYR